MAALMFSSKVAALWHSHQSNPGRAVLHRTQDVAMLGSPSESLLEALHLGSSPRDVQCTHDGISIISGQP
jgi:hypothetical protein